ncbi:MAG: hypothetical protein LM601_07980 [Candidatus Verstraetearchaeota archaeon]|nr:hypothetical protein [Candidatus Verstraetearchaeota archaeon]
MSIFEENRLIDLLCKFDANITLSYLKNLRKFEYEAHTLIGNLEPIRDASLPDPIAFRIKFSEPLLVMLSHPLCRMHKKVHYPIEFEEERFYVTQLGMLPVYFIDLNVITLIKFWGEAAEQVSQQALMNSLTRELSCMRLSPTNRNDIIYSTMNFIIPYGAELRKAPENVDEKASSYFKYSLWLSPKQGFSFSTHILHTKASIKYLLKVAKTLCLIDEINGYTKFQILNNKAIKAHKVTIRVLSEKNDIFFFKKRKVYIPEDVLSDLLAQDKISLKQSFLNAIILEVKRKTDSFELLSVLSDIGASSFELVQTLMSFVLMRIFNSNDKIAYICNVDELRRSLYNIMNQIREYIILPITISDKVEKENLFELAFDSLHPIFIRGENKIYYLHPALFNFLQNYPEFSLEKNNEKEIIKFLDFLEEKINNKNVKYVELYVDEILDAFHGKNKKEELLAKLSKLTQIIRIAKLLQKCF